jgi:hypothetical protein
MIVCVYDLEVWPNCVALFWRAVGPRAPNQSLKHPVSQFYKEGF